jgi:hypothetical protein
MIAIKRILEITCSVNTVPGWRSYASPDPVGSLRMKGEVKEYLGCAVIRDRAARTGKLVQAGYAERILRTFRMWDCNPVPLLTLMYA